MRDPQTLQVELWIENKIVSEVDLKKLPVLRLEDVERERVAAFLDPVDNPFKLGKHRLPKQCAAKIVDLSIDEISAHLRIACLPEQMMGKQLFVERRCDLGQKNWILVILKTLRFLRKPGVHRVTGFVRQGINVGKDVVPVIHEDIGRCAVTSR